MEFEKLGKREKRNWKIETTPGQDMMWESGPHLEEDEEVGGLDMFDEEKNVEFLSYDGYEVRYERDAIVFRYSFCDAVRMAPELKIDLRRYRQLATELATLSSSSSDPTHTLRRKVHIFFLYFYHFQIK
jgi:hypothetical protein